MTRLKGNMMLVQPLNLNMVPLFEASVSMHGDGFQCRICSIWRIGPDEE